MAEYGGAGDRIPSGHERGGLGAELAAAALAQAGGGNRSRFGRTQEITPLRTDSGPVEVREAASAFNRMFSSIQRSFEERERFLTSFSHDLRTPLTRLRLRLEQVAQDDLREKLCADVDRFDRYAEPYDLLFASARH